MSEARPINGHIDIADIKGQKTAIFCESEDEHNRIKQLLGSEDIMCFYDPQIPCIDARFGDVGSRGFYEREQYVIIDSSDVGGDARQRNPTDIVMSKFEFPILSEGGILVDSSPNKQTIGEIENGNLTMGQKSILAKEIAIALNDRVGQREAQANKLPLRNLAENVEMCKLIAKLMGGEFVSASYVNKWFVEINVNVIISHKRIPHALTINEEGTVCLENLETKSPVPMPNNFRVGNLVQSKYIF